MEQNEIKKTTPPLLEDNDLNQLADSIAHLVSDAKNHLVQTVNTTLVQTNWNVGRYIVEFEQKGNAKAKYGTELLTSLAKLLRIRLGKGYSRPSLYNMRRFYLLYPIFQTVSRKLSWSHICELITIDDALELLRENPPIGIVLGHNKDELMVEYATYGMDSNLFVSKYELYLPNKEELRRLVDGILIDGE